MSSPLTAIVLTYNESLNIQACLERLEWVDDIVLIDSFSTDNTLELAQQACPRIRILQNRFEDFAQQRNFALDQSLTKEHEWVLFLDADERCTPEVAAAITEAIEDPTIVGYYLTCRNFFLGRWIKRCTMYPSWQLRLLRRGAVRYRKEGHGQREVTEGPLGYLQPPYDHYGFSQGIHHWIARHNNYSTNEAELVRQLRKEPLRLREIFGSPVDRRRALKRLAARTGGLRPLARLFYLYVLRLGFLDGRAGLLFCMLRFAHEIHIVVKIAEAKQNDDEL